MSDDETTTTTNSMDVDTAPNTATPSPGVGSSTAVLDIGIGSGYISGSDDEAMTEPAASASSTPDSTTLPTTSRKKPTASGKHPLTKTKSSLVSYDRDSDDDEPSEEEHDTEENSGDALDGDDDRSNSNPTTLSQAGESDHAPIESTNFNEQGIVTSDLLNVTPFNGEDAASPSSRPEQSSNYPLIFPEDADIRIPPEPARNCSSQLEKKFEEYYKRFKQTGINQNARIQELKDFRNPCMYEKMISHLGIDEIGTNFPPDLYDPHWWGAESYYEELNKAQKLEMDRRQKERRDRTKIGFTPGVKKLDQIGLGSASSSDIGGEKRKTRFD